MKLKHVSFIACGVVALCPAAYAQVDFTQVDISEALTVSEIQTALSVASTNAIDGVALGPGGDIFIVHRDASNLETFARFDPVAKTSGFQRNATQVATDLGAPYTANLTLVGEFVWDADATGGSALYFADNSTASPTEYSLLRINTNTGAASQILRSGTIEGWNSHGVTTSGNIIGVLGEDFSGGEPQLGVVNPADGTPAFTMIFDADDFLDETPGAVETPVEAIAIDPVNNDAYVFAHDALELYRVPNIESPTTIERLEIAGWSGNVDLHGLAVDEDHNVYGYDEASESIRIWNGTDTYQLEFSDIETALGGAQPFTPAFWRGIKARKINADQSELWLASQTSSYGVVRVVFGVQQTSVSDWALY